MQLTLHLQVTNSLGSAFGLVADSNTITIVIESSTQTVRVQFPTLPVRFFYTAGPCRRLSIQKGSAIRAGGAVFSFLLNQYILSASNNKLLCEAPQRDIDISWGCYINFTHYNDTINKRTFVKVRRII